MKFKDEVGETLLWAEVRTIILWDIGKTSSEHCAPTYQSNFSEILKEASKMIRTLKQPYYEEMWLVYLAQSDQIKVKKLYDESSYLRQTSEKQGSSWN